MQPRKPTLAELDDLFNTPQVKLKNVRTEMGKYDYAISKLRTEYESLEDELEHVDYFNEIYDREKTEEMRKKLIHKLDSVYWAIERLKEVNE